MLHLTIAPRTNALLRGKVGLVSYTVVFDQVEERTYGERIQINGRQ
jgi:hypothetical protein